MPLADVSGRKVYYELHGEEHVGTATPLVLIMGMGGSCRGWLPLQVPHFAAKRPTLIFDNRGVAESDDPGGPFTTADLAHDTAGLLASLDIAQADVLGAFMGGMAAQELALHHPAQVRRLVLTGTYARPDAKRRMLLQDWAGLANSGVPLEAMVRKRLVWTLADDTLEQTDMIESMVEFFTREGIPLSRDLFARQCEACIAHDTLDELHGLTHETLILCGGNDQLTPPKFHRLLADLIPNAHLMTINFGAHLVMAESAERFNELVERFLDDD